MSPLPIRVLALTRYDRRGASSRYRTLQYVQPLQPLGVQMTCRPLVDSGYLDRRYNRGRRVNLRVAAGFLRRAVDLIRCGAFDVVWLEKEAMPWLPEGLERFLTDRRVPLVVDFDDALFHLYDQHPRRLVRRLLSSKHDRIMARSACVTVGNDYLAQRAWQAGAHRVETLPTAVDLSRYHVRTWDACQGPLTVGWIGTPWTQRYLHLVGDALALVAAQRPLRLHAIGAQDLRLPGVEVHCLPWSEATEGDRIRQCDVGIMPLADTPTERGKSGLKLMQYMAAGLPVIGSPVGINGMLIRPGQNGFSPTDTAGWAAALMTLADQPALRQSFGHQGRRLIEAEYQLAVTAPRLAAILKESATGVRQATNPAAALRPAA